MTYNESAEEIRNTSESIENRCRIIRALARGPLQQFLVTLMEDNFQDIQGLAEKYCIKSSDKDGQDVP